MSYLIDINEDLSEQIQDQLRKFRRNSRGGFSSWYRTQVAIAKLRDNTIYHHNIDKVIAPNLFDEDGNAVDWYHLWDPQCAQVNMIKRNLVETSSAKRQRGRVTPFRLRLLMMEILNRRLEEYANPSLAGEKRKLMCIVGASGSGKTLASLHLKNFKDANVICSFTTRPPRTTEIEGREHHFIDIVPDRDELIAYSHFAGYYYYAMKWQVFGPCTVYVIDEKGLHNLRRDCGDLYDIYTVLIKRHKRLRKKCGITHSRMIRDKHRAKISEDEYDYVVENNSSKKNFFQQIEQIYEEIKNK